MPLASVGGQRIAASPSFAAQVERLGGSPRSPVSARP